MELDKPSFPRKRESKPPCLKLIVSSRNSLDSRFRGNDGGLEIARIVWDEATSPLPYKADWKREDPGFPLSRE